jgi:hypothetical protein
LGGVGFAGGEARGVGGADEGHEDQDQALQLVEAQVPGHSFGKVQAKTKRKAT